MYRVLLTSLYMTEHLYAHPTLPRNIFSDVTKEVLEDRGYSTGKGSLDFNFKIQTLKPLKKGKYCSQGEG